MIVMKFGGSSVKDADAVDRVATIVKSRLPQNPVVVVSAFGKTTDKLIAILDALAASRESDARALLTEIASQHREVIENLAPAGDFKNQAQQMLDENLARLSRLIDGMACLGEVSPRSRDAVLAFGELTAAPLLAAFLSLRGLPAVAVDPRRLIVTDGQFGSAVPIVEPTMQQCQGELHPLLQAGQLPIIGGFVGATAQGVASTLGRGGSDLTASMIAKALSAHSLEYWKDVDGILSADPRLVPEARPLSELSFQEAAELAFLGAKVLHPASIQPAVEAGVPVRVLNSYRSTSPGTVITKMEVKGPAPNPFAAVSSVACKRDQLMVNVYSTRMLGATGFLRRVFEVFDRLNLSVDHIATSEVNVTVTLAPTERVEELKQALGEVANIEIQPKVGVVSVVGRHLPFTPGVAARIFSALKNTNVKLVTYGGSGVNLSLVVHDSEVPLAVKSLHQELLVSH